MVVVLEMVDMGGCDPPALSGVWVRIPSTTPLKKGIIKWLYLK